MRGFASFVVLVFWFAIGCGDDRGPGTGPGTDGGTTDPGALPASCSSGPLSAPKPGCAPARLPTSGSPYTDCVARINQFRAECQCLPPLARWTEGESCADTHAEYDANNPSPPHAGFQSDVCSPRGQAQNECPGWPSTEGTLTGCLQQMWDEGPGEPFIEHGHYLNMSNTRFSKVACGFYVNDAGRVWATQNFAQ